MDRVRVYCTYIFLKNSFIHIIYFSKALPDLEKLFFAGLSKAYFRLRRKGKSSRSPKYARLPEKRTGIRFRTSARSSRSIREPASRAFCDDDPAPGRAKSPSRIWEPCFWTNCANFRPTCSTRCANRSKTAKYGYPERSRAIRIRRGSSCSRHRTPVRAGTPETGKNRACALRRRSKGTVTAYPDPFSTASTFS